SEGDARRLAARYLFEGEEVFKPVGTLSGGERRRLALAVLACERANFLLLDEPTNHLDLPSREALEAVLTDFEGTLVFVSHDRFLIDRLATVVWAIEDGALVVSLGHFTDYQRKRMAERPQSPTRATSPPTPSPPVQKPHRSPRHVERELAQLERTIERLEERMRQLTEELDEATARQDPEAIAELGVTYHAVQAELEEAYARWEVLQEELLALRAGS
ncbi:MAG: ATP-binding cassette domain-containing protein, partial [Thermomicrobium sp.]|nr:ATP-binding cassette domain-containing protein [Thermomicrobium sp.]